MRGVSLAVPRGETFGFLGINGAGKTTTLSVLTGDVARSQGHALVEGADVGDPGTLRRIGYCPQEDPLLELMTGAETLSFFGRLKVRVPPSLECVLYGVAVAVVVVVVASTPVEHLRAEFVRDTWRYGSALLLSQK